MQLADIQRRRSRLSLPSRPQPLAFPQLGEFPATVGDVKAQPVRMADVFIFGPMMIYSGLGKMTPRWLRVGMIIIGAGTILYNLNNYFLVERRKIESGIVADPEKIEGELLPGLEGMEWGPMHRAHADLTRQGLLVRR